MKPAMPSGDKGLIIAVVGASARCSFLLDYLARNPRQGAVAGLYDIVPERCEIYKSRYGLSGAKTYRSLEEAVQDESADAVLVSTPDSAHAEPVIAALKAGKHVYCEKPLATTLADCDAIDGAAKASGRTFYLGMNLRHGPVHETVHDIVAGGEIGKVLMIEANERYYGGRTYFRRWNRFVERSGGLWITKATHDFDLLNWIAGGRPLRVSAASSLSWYKRKDGAAELCRDCAFKLGCQDYFDFASADPLSIASEKAGVSPVDLCLYNSGKDTFDNGQALIEYDNDVRAVYSLSVVASRSNRQMCVSGTDGLIEADMDNASVVVTKRHSGKRISYDLGKLTASSHGGADDRILADFLNCCRTGQSPRSGCADGRASVLVGLAARKSCQTHNSVELKDFETERI